MNIPTNLTRRDTERLNALAYKVRTSPTFALRAYWLGQLDKQVNQLVAVRGANAMEIENMLVL